MQKIRPCLWFDGKAEEAARHYVSIFKDGKVLSVNPVVTIFAVHGMEIMALNGGPQYKPTAATSLCVHCETQAEIDALWDGLTADGGEPGRCGWLTDRYGFSWQIVPKAMPLFMSDPQKAQRVIQAFMKMSKLDIAALEAAAAG